MVLFKNLICFHSVFGGFLESPERMGKLPLGVLFFLVRVYRLPVDPAPFGRNSEVVLEGFFPQVLAPKPDKLSLRASY